MTGMVNMYIKYPTSLASWQRECPKLCAECDFILGRIRSNVITLQLYDQAKRKIKVVLFLPNSGALDSGGKTVFSSDLKRTKHQMNRLSLCLTRKFIVWWC